MANKIVIQTISIDAKTTKQALNATIRSYDSQDTLIQLTLTSEIDLDFNNAAAKAVIEYYADKKYVVETSANVSDNVLSFALPTNLKGYDGYAVIGVYVDLADGSKIDIKDLVVKCEPSIIDKAAIDAQPYYFSNLESVLIEFKKYASSKADELDNDVISAKQEIADKVASVDSQSAIDAIDSKVADVDSHATTIKADMDTRLNDVDSHATDTLTNVNNVATKAKSDITNLVANAQTNADTASQQVNAYATSTKADMDATLSNVQSKGSSIKSDMDTAKTSIDDYATTQKSDIDSMVEDVNSHAITQKQAINDVLTSVGNHATTQKQQINSVVSDVESVGDTAKADINAVLPSVQSKLDAINAELSKIDENMPSVYLAYADSEDGSVGFTKFKPPRVLGATFLDSTKRFIGMSVKDSNDYRDYVWIPNPELSKNWQYYELASTILDDCNKEYSSIYNFDTVTYLEAINGAKVDKINPYFILKQKEQNSNNVLSIRYRNISNSVFSFIAEQDGQFDNDWYLVDTNDNKMYIRSGLNIFMAPPKAIGKDGDIVNHLKIRNTLYYTTNGLVFNFGLTQDEIIKITTIVYNTINSRYTLYQKIMNGIVLYAYPQGSVVLMQNDTSPTGLLKRGVWSKLGEIALTNPDGKLTAWVRSL